MLPWVRIDTERDGSEESRRKLVRFVDRVFGPHLTLGEAISTPTADENEAMQISDLMEAQRQAYRKLHGYPSYESRRQRAQMLREKKAKAMRAAWWKGFWGMFSVMFIWASLGVALGTMSPFVTGVPTWVPYMISWGLIVLGSAVMGQMEGNDRRHEVIEEYREAGHQDHVH